MSKYFTIGAVVLIIAIISTAYLTGRADGIREEKLNNAKADQAQMDEAREIKNAVEKLDDAGLRDAINGVR